MLESSIKEDWKPVLADFEHSEAGKKIEQLLAKQKAEGLKIFPPKPYRALELLSAGEVKVVILGQDPYHGCRWYLSSAYDRSGLCKAG